MTQNAQSTYNRLPVPPVLDNDPAATLHAFARYLSTELLRIQEAIRPETTRSVSANTTADVTDSVILVNATAGGRSITLPDPTTVGQKTLTIKKTDASGNAVTVVGTVDGAANPTLPAVNNATTFISDGSQWHVVSNNF